MDKNFLTGFYLEVVRAWPNRWLGVFIAATVVAVIAVVVTAMPDRYSSKARVYIENEAILEPLLTGITQQSDPDDKVRMLRVVQVTLLNENNIDRILATPDIGFDVSTPRGRSRAARAIRSGSSITEQETEDNLYDLTYTDTDPERAMKVAKALLGVLIEWNSSPAQAGYSGARKFLDEQIASYQARLNELETQIMNFRLANADYLGATTHQQRLEAALTVLRDAQLVLRIAVGNRDRVAAMINSGSRQGNESILASDATFPAAIDRLGALQAQLNTLLLQYTDDHPDVLATKREIALLTRQYGLGENLGAVAAPFATLPGQVPPAQAVNAAAGGAVGPASQQAAAASGAPLPTTPTAMAAGGGEAAQLTLVRANFAVLDAERKVRDATAAVKAIDVQSQRAPEAEAQLAQLIRTHAVMKENYELLIRKREVAQITQAAGAATGIEQFRVIETPTLPSKPSSPDRPTILLLGALASVLAGAALAYGLSLFRATFASAAEAEQALGLPVIARLTHEHGLVKRFAYFTDTTVLLGSIIGIFAFAYAVSANESWALPIRAQIYRLLESGGLVALFA